MTCASRVGGYVVGKQPLYGCLGVVGVVEGPAVKSGGFGGRRKAIPVKLPVAAVQVVTVAGGNGGGGRAGGSRKAISTHAPPYHIAMLKCQGRSSS